MKKALIAVAAMMATLAAQAADGQIILGNFSTAAGLNSPVSLSGGAFDGQKAFNQFQLQLFRVVGGSETAVGPAITFRGTSGTASGAGTFANTTITLPNFGDASGPATFRAKGFGLSGDALQYVGTSPDFTATVNVAPTPPTLTTAFPAFTLVVPEPSTIALAALGGAALLLRRRK